MPDYKFDTDRIDPMMNELDAVLHTIGSTPVEVDVEGVARHNDPNKAEVRQQYWAFKGYDDPTDHDLTREE